MLQDFWARSLQQYSNTDWDVVRNETMQFTNSTNNSTVTNTTFVTDPGDGGGQNVVEYTAMDYFYYALSISALIVFCFCSRSRIPDERFRIAAAERRARWLESQEHKDRMVDADYRAGLVKKGIVVKKVIDEKDGQLTLGDYHYTYNEEEDHDSNNDDDSSGGGSISIDSNDENVSTCVICLEAFRVGDVVAWSRTLLEATEEETCNHGKKNDSFYWLLSECTCFAAFSNSGSLLVSFSQGLHCLLVDGTDTW